MRLLVVDDNREVREALLECLRSAGHSVVLAASGEDAIAMASGCRPDMLLTDLDLGAGMDGLTLGCEARRRWPLLPIIFISGRLRTAAQTSGCRKAFIRKPFRAGDLLVRVTELAAADTT